MPAYDGLMGGLPVAQSVLRVPDMLQNAVVVPVVVPVVVQWPWLPYSSDIQIQV